MTKELGINRFHRLLEDFQAKHPEKKYTLDESLLFAKITSIISEQDQFIGSLPTIEECIEYANSLEKYSIGILIKYAQTPKP